MQAAPAERGAHPGEPPAAAAGQQQQHGAPAAASPAAAPAAAAADPELAADALSQAAAGMLLPFQRQIVEELLEEDGLCVLSPGMGLPQVVAVLLRLQVSSRGWSACVCVCLCSGRHALGRMRAAGASVWWSAVRWARAGAESERHPSPPIMPRAGRPPAAARPEGGAARAGRLPLAARRPAEGAAAN